MKLQNVAVAEWTILLVDDEPDNLRPAVKILEHAGATVKSAQDGVRGLEIVAETKPTLILMDLSMPGMDGWEMLAHIRSNKATEQIPVIAVTAHAMVGDEERALAAGFDAYITKPFRPSILLEKIRQNLTDKSIS